MTFITVSNANIESPLDAYGRLQVSNPLTLFTSKQYSDDAPDEIDTLTNGTGSINYTAPYPHTNMQVVSNGDRVVRQTKFYAPYQAGKSLIFQLTGTLINDSSIPNVRARIGQFDDLNDKTVDTQPTGDGFFFEVIGGTPPTVNLVYRSSNTTTGVLPPSQVDTVVPQSSWNLDTLDGTGKSGYTFDPQERQIFTIVTAWLGVGDILCGMYNDNKFIPCHRFNFLGEGPPIAYSTRGSLPARYEIEAIGVPSSTAIMRQICMSISSDAGFTPRGRIFSVPMTALKNINTTSIPMISLRLNQTATAYKSVRTALNIVKSNIIVSSKSDILYQIVLFKTPTKFGAGPLTGASWVNQSGNISITNSYAEYDISATAVDLSGATYPFKVFDTGYMTDTVSIINADVSDRILLILSDIAGISDMVTITMRTLTGNQNVAASLQWQEIQ